MVGKNKFLCMFCVASLQFAFAGQGAYFEWKNSVVSAGTNSLQTMKQYFMDGDRKMSIIDANDHATVMMWKAMTPGFVYFMDEKGKTYHTMFNKEGLVTSTGDSINGRFGVTLLGKEKVNSYNCFHIKVVPANSISVQEMWVSAEIADYTFLINNYEETGELLKALQAKDIAGFPVRVVTNSEGATIQTDLIKCEKQVLDTVVFSVSGYKKTSGPEPVALKRVPLTPAQIAATKDYQNEHPNFENMTPQMRIDYLKKQKEKSQEQPH